METVAQRQDRDLAGARAVDRQGHGLFRDHMAKALLTVHQQEGAVLVHDAGRGRRVQMAGLNPADIGGDHADTVAVMSGQIGPDQTGCDAARGVRRATGLGQDLLGQGGQLRGADLHGRLTFSGGRAGRSGPGVMARSDEVCSSCK